MSKSQNRHDTKKWKEKRKDHHGDRCKNAKCGICSHEKKYKIGKKKYQIRDKNESI